jgi:DNA-binding MarR family transcriptional regulator
MPSRLFGEPAWDLLLDLFASEHEGKSVSISSACLAASVPATTGLRHVTKLEEQGLVTRVSAPDRRMSLLKLTEYGRSNMEAILIRLIGDVAVDA